MSLFKFILSNYLLEWGFNLMPERTPGRLEIATGMVRYAEWMCREFKKDKKQ